MRSVTRSAKVNVKILMILLALVVLLGAVAGGGWFVRKRLIVIKELAAGEYAYNNADFPGACKHFRRYLSKKPDDPIILEKYARANLLVRPLRRQNIASAIAAYRRLIRVDPDNAAAYDKLAAIYDGTRQHQELTYIAGKRLERVPGDPKATIWLVRGLLAQQKDATTRQATEILQELIVTLEDHPKKHDEYAIACQLLGKMALSKRDVNLQTGAIEAQEWLDRAVQYNPAFAGAMVARARFIHENFERLGWTREQMQAAVRSDLEQADTLKPHNPVIRIALSEVWTELGQLDRAALELTEADKLSDPVIQRYFTDPADWATMRFLQWVKLAARGGTISECVPITDETLAKVKHHPQRTVVLKRAVRVYLSVNRLHDARKYLNEYLDAVATTKISAINRENLALLQALVLREEDNLYGVIEVLEPVIVHSPSDPLVWKLLAEAYSKTDQIRRSVKALIEYLRLNTRNLDMTLQLAREYIKLRDWNRAYETARLAEPLDPTDIIIKLLRIETGFQVASKQSKGERDAWLDSLGSELKKLRKEHPKRVDIRVLQSGVAFAQGLVKLAEQELKIAIAECDEPLQAELQLARVYFRTKRLGEAIRIAKIASKRHSKRADPWLILSELQRSARKNAKSRATLIEAQEHVTDHWEKRDISIRLAVCEIADGEHRNGIGRLENLARQDERELYARLLLLRIPEIYKDEALAQKLVDEIRTVQGESGLLWRLHQARVWLSRDEWTTKHMDITKMLNHCVEADPEWSAPTLILGGMYSRLGDLDSAERIYRQSLIRNPAATDVAGRLLSLLERQERFSDAQEVLGQLESSGSFNSAWEIRTALRKGDLSRAIDELKLRLASNEQDSESLILLGRLIYWETADRDQALNYLKKAEAIDPKSMALMGAKVHILHSEGQVDQAQQILDEQVDNHSSFGTYLMRAVYLRRTGRLELAEKDYIKLTTFSGKGRLRAYQLLGRFYTDTGRLDDTVATLDEALKDHQTDVGLRRNMVKVLLLRNAQGDAIRAEILLKALERQLPDDPDLLRVRAMQMIAEGTAESFQKASKILQRVVTLDPTSVTAHLGLINLALRNGEIKNAQERAIRALGINPENIALILARAQAEYQLANYALAAEVGEMVLLRDPANARAHGLVIDAWGIVGNEDALKNEQKRLKHILERDQANPEIQLAYAAVLKTLNQADTAIGVLEEFARTSTGRNNPEVLLNLARLYRAGGDLGRAEEYLGLAKALTPNSNSIAVEEIILLAARKDYGRIISVVSTRKQTKPLETEVLGIAADVLASSQDPEHLKEAMRWYDEIVKNSPNSLHARLRVASLAYRTGDVNLAERIYSELHEKHPNNPDVLNDLAWILSNDRQEYGIALRLADKGIMLAPMNHHLRDTRALILTHLPNRLSDAKRDYQKCVELTANSHHARARALTNLGLTCAKLGEHAQASRSMKEALKIHDQYGVLTKQEHIELKQALIDL